MLSVELVDNYTIEVARVLIEEDKRLEEFDSSVVDSV